MTSIWPLAIIPVLAWLLFRVRRARRLAHAPILSKPETRVEQVSATELADFVREMSETLEPSSKVLSPNHPSESSHIWDSPSGKRVYMN